MAHAARRGRKDVLDAMDRRGIPLTVHGLDELILACARGDTGRIQEIAAWQPKLVTELVDQGGTLLAEFAGTANTEGVGRLLDLGVPIRAEYGGDGYFGIASKSTALHVAAWKAWHDTVKFLIARGAPVNIANARGQTPLDACRESVRRLVLVVPPQARLRRSAATRGSVGRRGVVPVGLRCRGCAARSAWSRRMTITLPVSRHVGVADTVRSVAFYRDVLGFAASSPLEPGITAVELGAAHLEVEPATAPRPSVLFTSSLSCGACSPRAGETGGRTCLMAVGLRF